MDIKNYVFSLFPGKTGMRYRKKASRKNVIGSDERFSAAIKKCTSKLAIDLGANQGKYTTILAENFDHVIAFEPNPDVFETLSKNLQHNTNVELYQQAAGTEDGTTKMFLRTEYDSDPLSYSEGTTLFSTKENIDTNKSISVKIINIVQFIERLDQEIGIIKIDIEGAEIPILESLLDSPSLQRIEYIFVETHEFKIPELYRRTVGLRKRVKKLEKPRIDMNWG